LSHFLSLIVFAVVVSACFALIMKPTKPERWRYFFWLLFCFIGSGFVLGWVMYFFPFK